MKEVSITSLIDSFDVVCVHNHFTKTVKDIYLWQLVNFPTRGDNILDLILTNTPNKVSNVQGFDDILNTDHKLVSFNINLKIQKKPKAKRSIYNFKNANCSGLKEMLLYAPRPWAQCYVPDNIDKSLSNWCDLFLSAVDNHIPKYRVKNTHDHPWIDKELLHVIKKKNIQRRKLKKSQSLVDAEKYKSLRRNTKQLISKKKKAYNKKLTESLLENPKCFWSAVKSITKTRQNVNFLRTDGSSFTSDRLGIANALNKFFHSVFNPREEKSTMPYVTSTPSKDILSDIKLTEYEVIEVLRQLDPNKACGPDCIPSRLLLELADGIAPSLSDLFNMSLSLGVVPAQWKRANITPVFKKDDPTLCHNYRPISLLCVLSKVLEGCIHTIPINIWSHLSITYNTVL